MLETWVKNPKEWIAVSVDAESEDRGEIELTTREPVNQVKEDHRDQ